jgi:hypothetical protein
MTTAKSELDGEIKKAELKVDEAKIKKAYLDKAKPNLINRINEMYRNFPPNNGRNAGFEQRHTSPSKGNGLNLGALTSEDILILMIWILINLLNLKISRMVLRKRNRLLETLGC